MASFLQPSADPFGQMQLYQPDWGFLTQVLGHKQAEYDRGFDMIYSTYSKLLNSPLSNPNNEEFRQNAFDKLQKSLRSVSALDLSNPANIQRGLKLVDPLVEDRDFAYDLAWTQKSNQAKQQLSEYKNSTDPEVRKLYNPIAEEYMMLGQEKMANAKRGDGSIQRNSPLEFVPFHDVNEYLNKQAKDQKLKITYSTAQNGYIIESIDGERAIPAFSEWAAMQMSNGMFDRQFQVMSHVTSEKTIRNLEAEGLSREEAINTVVGSYVEKIKIQEGRKLKQIENSLDSVNRQIERFPSHVTSEEGEQIKALSEIKQMLELARNNIAENLQTYDANKEYSFNNLEHIINQTIQNDMITSWATTKAMTTESTKIKADQTALTMAKLNFEQLKHYDNMNLAYARLQLDAAKLHASGTSGASGKRGTATTDGVGYALPDGSTAYATTSTLNTEDESAVIAYYEKFNETKQQIANSSIDLIDMIYPDEKASAYRETLNKALNNPLRLNDTERSNLIKLADELNIEGFKVGETAEEMQLSLIKISSALYDKGQSNMEGMTPNEARKMASIATNLEDVFTQYRGSLENIANLSEMVLNAKEETEGKWRSKNRRFQNARVVSTYGGKSIVDFSELDPSHLKEIYVDKINADESFRASQSVTSSYTVKGINPGVLGYMVYNDEFGRGLDKGVRKQINDAFENINEADLRKSMGDAMGVVIQGNNVVFQLNLNKGTAGNQAVNIPIPIEEIMSAGPALEPIKYLIEHNRDKRELSGKYAPLLEGNTLHSPEYMKKDGFEYTMQKRGNSSSVDVIITTTVGNEKAKNRYQIPIDVSNIHNNMRKLDDKIYQQFIHFLETKEQNQETERLQSENLQPKSNYII